MKKTLILFFFIMFVIGTDTFLISPLLPTLSDLYNVSMDKSGWMVSSYALGYALFAFIAGPLSDNLDRKKVMMYGMFFFAISTFLCAEVSNFWMMCLMRLISGISAAFITPQIWASIPLVVKPEKIIKSMGIVTAGLAVSQAFGLPIGSFLASFSWRIPFFILAGSSFVLLILIGFIIPSIKQNGQEKKLSIMKRYGMLFSNAQSIPLFAAYFMFQTGNFASFNFLGTWLNEDYHFNISQIGTSMIILGVGNFVGSIVGNGLINKFGKFNLLLSGLIVMALLYVTLPYYHNVWFVETVFFVLFFISGVIFPIMMSSLQSLSAETRGTIAALSNAMMYIGVTIGSFIAGNLYHHFGIFNAVTFFTSILFFISFLLYKKTISLKEKADS